MQNMFAVPMSSFQDLSEARYSCWYIFYNKIEILEIVCKNPYNIMRKLEQTNLFGGEMWPMVN